MSSSTQASIHFLKRLSKYETEKVYELKYDPPPGLPKTNMCLERRDHITVEDMRHRESGLKIDERGYQIITLEDGLELIDYDDQASLLQHYFPLLAQKVKEVMLADRVQIFDYNVSP